MMSLAALLTRHDLIQVAHHFGGGVYVKETFIEAGACLAQHKHEHDHLSYLVAGTVVLEVDGVRSTLRAPACLTLEAGKHHGIRAETDAIWLCIWQSDCTDPAEVDGTLVSGDSDGAAMQAMVQGLAHE
jgi:quercetin dioxygenase-like cupin family protein